LPFIPANAGIQSGPIELIELGEHVAARLQGQKALGKASGYKQALVPRRIELD
jgi:hypothetical protein